MLAPATVTVFTVTVNTGIVETVMSVPPDTQLNDPASEEWTVDELARRAGLPVRTIREYQTVGLLHSPRRSGRIGLYEPSHLRRLHLIARLQHRGYSLAGIGDLLAAWRSGDAISDVLGLEADQLVHVDEPGAPATLDQLTKLLPALVPDRLDDLLATGVVELCGPDRYCVPSPSLLQLTIDAITAGLEPDIVLTLLAHLRTAADTASGALLDAFAHMPVDTDPATIDAVIARGRGLIAHGIGRLTLHCLGRAVGAPDHATSTDLAALIRGPARQPRTRGPRR
jgi:DNA-binding transcriptional MerR regulator